MNVLARRLALPGPPRPSNPHRYLEILIDPKKLSQPRPKTRNIKKKSSFVDRTRLQATGGRGGKGSTSNEYLSRKHYRRPDGGHGGDGGSVIIVADPRQQSLGAERHVEAEWGNNGGPQARAGRNGNNTIIRVPCGVVVKKVLDPGDQVQEQQLMQQSDDGQDGGIEFFAMSEDELDEPVQPDRETVVLADLDAPGAHILVARGGHGGYGSCLYASEHGPKPDAETLQANAQPQPGEVAYLELELKLIADIGLVGFPNAGKSSLLRAMSEASPKVAPYPFTTLHPIIGCVDYQDGFRLKVADLPGLIEDAAQGRGQGHDFLRHMERTKALLYMIDIASTDFRDPMEDLMVLADELDSYGDGSLLERPALVVGNKTDLLTPGRVPEMLHRLGQVAQDIGIQLEHDVMGVSAGVSGEGLEQLSRAMRQTVVKSDADRRAAFEADHNLAGV